MMRWIPKDAGYISKVSRSGLEDNGTRICLNNDDKLGLDHNILIFKTLQDSGPQQKPAWAGLYCLPEFKEAIVFQFRGRAFPILQYVIGLPYF